jgi:hypothetical protein
VADVEYFNTLLFLQDAVYHTINMRLVAIEQVPQLIFRPYCRATTVRILLQTENGLFETKYHFRAAPEFSALM